MLIICEQGWNTASFFQRSDIAWRRYNWIGNSMFNIMFCSRLLGASPMFLHLKPGLHSYLCSNPMSSAKRRHLHDLWLLGIPVFSIICSNPRSPVFVGCSPSQSPRGVSIIPSTAVTALGDLRSECRQLSSDIRTLGEHNEETRLGLNVIQL